MAFHGLGYALSSLTSSRPSNFSVEDYSYMNPIEIMYANDTIVPKELNIDTHNFTAKIINFHRNENHTNNPVYEKECLEKFDKVLSDFGNKYDYPKNEYDILDLDNFEYITYKSTKHTAADAKFDERSDIQYFLYEHNYCMIEEATPTCAETLDTSKLSDSYKTEEKSLIDIPYFNGVHYNVGELDKSPQFCDMECNLQELNVESGNFVIPNYISTDNINSYTISDNAEKNIDIEAPELDVISISSASSLEDRFDVINVIDSNSCGYHSSDFEFIEEHEAKRDGLIINYKPQTIKGDKVKTIDIAKEYNSQELVLDYFSVPAVSDNIEYKIPQDNNYISMFERNIPYPVNCMENKSLYASNCSMNTEYRDLSFTMGLFDREIVDKHVQDEASESEKKILFMYPFENRRQRRRI